MHDLTAAARTDTVIILTPGSNVGDMLYTNHVGSSLAIMLKIPTSIFCRDGAIETRTRSVFFPPHEDETKASSWCSVVTQVLRGHDTLPEPAI